MFQDFTLSEKYDSSETINSRIKRLGELADACSKKSSDMEEHREILRMVAFVVFPNF